MRFVKKFIVYVFVILILASNGFVLYRYQKGDRLLSVQTGSMIPAFAPGDAVITRKVNLADLYVGDIVSYRNPKDPQVIVSHRLVNINYQTGKLMTKGDALDLQDIPLPSSLLIGKVFKILPKVGYGLDWLHNPTGLIIAIYTPAAILLIYEVKRVNRQYSKPIYRLHGYR